MIAVDSKRARFGSQLFAVLILIAGALLRLLHLDTNPPGLWQDEASTGVDAYLIWTTGRDRAGDFLPVISRSFGDYPLALYRYLDAPIVGLFGLTIGNERLVAALSGTLMIASTGFALWPLLGSRVALAAMLSAAFAPTWIHFSRYGSEAILLPCALIIGFALIEHARLRRRHELIWLGVIALAASAYTYHAVKIFLPLWMLGFLWYQRPLIAEIWREKKLHLIGPALLFVLLVSPSMIEALTPEGMARGRTVAAWTHFSGMALVKQILNNYLTYFDVGMLFVRGGPAVAQSIPHLGLWNLIDLPAIVAGFMVMLRNTNGEHGRFYRFIIFWFLIGPIPGGITYETHNIGRVIGWLPAPQIISGIGLAAIVTGALERLRDGVRLRPLSVLALFTIGWIFTAGLVWHLTIVRYPVLTERDWQFEISRVMLCAKAQRGDRQLVIAPQFQAAEVFAKFHLSDLKPLAPDRPAWSFGNRSHVPSTEIYVAPASEKRPPGEIICDIRLKSGGDTRAYAIAGLRDLNK